MICVQQSWTCRLNPRVYMKISFSYPHCSFWFLQSLCLEIPSTTAVRVSRLFQTEALRKFLPNFSHLILYWEKVNACAVKEKWLLPTQLSVTSPGSEHSPLGKESILPGNAAMGSSFHKEEESTGVLLIEGVYRKFRLQHLDPGDSFHCSCRSWNLPGAFRQPLRLG